jgi:GrpB-like predicted nucleotidyltransferase (UPF0157 family)
MPPLGEPAGEKAEPDSAEGIQAAPIRPPGPHNAPIALAEYDPAWPALFAREEERIRGALGDRVVMLEHAGSTSVPGLAAKPRIDIVLAVPDSAAEEAYVPALEQTGYFLAIREPDWFEHRVLKRDDLEVNLHVFTAGASEIDRMLLFRDRLRTHPADRQAYEQVKRDLAGRTWAHVQDYADAKTEIVRQITDRAAEERDEAHAAGGQARTRAGQAGPA